MWFFNALLKHTENFSPHCFVALCFLVFCSSCLLHFWYLVSLRYFRSLGIFSLLASFKRVRESFSLLLLLKHVASGYLSSSVRRASRTCILSYPRVTLKPDFSSGPVQILLRHSEWYLLMACLPTLYYCFASSHWMGRNLTYIGKFLSLLPVTRNTILLGR